jgi:probable F420-dependent oxidoreductase
VPTNEIDVGIVTFATEHTIGPGELAAAAESRGFTSLWFAEHSHIPLSRLSAWQGGAELPRWYYETFDSIVAMASAAAATDALRVGTGVAVLVQRDPITFAKEIATLDVVSGGRVDVGVGGGWNLEEMADHGTDPATRWKLLRERVEALKAIWTMDQAEYHGELVDFGPMASFPKPRQKPHPPIHVGGRYPQGMRRAIRYGDGWMPIVGRGGPDPASLATEMRRAAADAGRDPSSLEFTAYGAPRDRSELARLQVAGADRVLFFVRPCSRDEVFTELDNIAGLAIGQLNQA